MSGFAGDLQEMRAGMASRARRWRAMVERATAGPLLVRGGVWAAGIAAMTLAYPTSLVLNRYGLVLIGLAALPALAPRSMLVTPVVLVAAGGWVIATMGYGEPVTLWRLVALAGSLYLTHNAAALAAQLPYDAVVSPAVLARWFARAGLVLAGTTLLGGYLLVIGELLRGRVSVLATVAGVGIAVAAAYVLARQLRREPD